MPYNVYSDPHDWILLCATIPLLLLFLVQIVVTRLAGVAIPLLKRHLHIVGMLSCMMIIIRTPDPIGPDEADDIAGEGHLYSMQALVLMRRIQVYFHEYAIALFTSYAYVALHRHMRRAIPTALKTLLTVVAILIIGILLTLDIYLLVAQDDHPPYGPRLAANIVVLCSILFFMTCQLICYMQLRRSIHRYLDDRKRSMAAGSIGGSADLSHARHGGASISTPATGGALNWSTAGIGIGPSGSPTLLGSARLPGSFSVGGLKLPPSQGNPPLKTPISGMPQVELSALEPLTPLPQGHEYTLTGFTNNINHTHTHPAATAHTNNVTTVAPHSDVLPVRAITLLQQRSNSVGNCHSIPLGPSWVDDSDSTSTHPRRHPPPPIFVPTLNITPESHGRSLFAGQSTTVSASSSASASVVTSSTVTPNHASTHGFTSPTTHTRTHNSTNSNNHTVTTNDRTNSSIRTNSDADPNLSALSDDSPRIISHGSMVGVAPRTVSEPTPVHGPRMLAPPPAGGFGDSPRTSTSMNMLPPRHHMHGMRATGSVGSASPGVPHKKTFSVDLINLAGFVPPLTHSPSRMTTKVRHLLGVTVVGADTPKHIDSRQAETQYLESRMAKIFLFFAITWTLQLVGFGGLLAVVLQSSSTSSHMSSSRGGISWARLYDWHCILVMIVLVWYAWILNVSTLRSCHWANWSWNWCAPPAGIKRGVHDAAIAIPTNNTQHHTNGNGNITSIIPPSPQQFKRSHSFQLRPRNEHGGMRLSIGSTLFPTRDPALNSSCSVPLSILTSGGAGASMPIVEDAHGASSLPSGPTPVIPLAQVREDGPVHSRSRISRTEVLNQHTPTPSPRHGQANIPSQPPSPANRMTAEHVKPTSVRPITQPIDTHAHTASILTTMVGDTMESPTDDVDPGVGRVVLRSSRPIRGMSIDVSRISSTSDSLSLRASPTGFDGVTGGGGGDIDDLSPLTPATPSTGPSASPTWQPISDDANGVAITAITHQYHINKPASQPIRHSSRSPFFPMNAIHLNSLDPRPLDPGLTPPSPSVSASFDLQPPPPHPHPTHAPPTAITSSSNAHAAHASSHPPSLTAGITATPTINADRKTLSIHIKATSQPTTLTTIVDESTPNSTSSACDSTPTRLRITVKSV